MHWAVNSESIWSIDWIEAHQVVCSLLFTYAPTPNDGHDEAAHARTAQITSFQCDAMASRSLRKSSEAEVSDDRSLSISAEMPKTYVALVRGEGILHGQNFCQKGWFCVDRPIRNEYGILKNATAWFRFVAGQSNINRFTRRPRAVIALARPETGR